MNTKNGDFMQILVRSILVFVMLFIVTKFLGKKQLQHLTMYDYVIGITIGSIAADGIISVDLPVTNALLALVIFGAIGYGISYLTYKDHDVLESVDGQPIILFQDGKFIKSNLAKTKFSVAKVLEYCRLKGCFDLAQLDCAILEPSGGLSVLLKTNYQSSTTGEFKNTNLKKSFKQTLCYDLIIDGKIDISELKRAKKTKTWVKEILKQNNKKCENVLLLSVNGYDEVTIY